ALPALLVERTGPVSALWRSSRLVKGRWWPSAGVLIVPSVMAAIVGGAHFLARRETLDPGARRALAQRLASGLRPKVTGAPEGIGAETFLERLAEFKRGSAGGRPRAEH
ncbi:MAG: hypothetical protein QOG59_1823, partial [Solirubrobacteraceae bacterium]|nr:hypothetical protein [Solirubrobacteraceae bacterium]